MHSKWWGIALTWFYFATATWDACVGVGKYVHGDDWWPMWIAFATVILYWGIQRLIRQETVKQPANVTLKLDGKTLAQFAGKYWQEPPDTTASK